MEQEHHRHRLSRPYYSGHRTYFLTICARNRTKLFTDGRIVEPLISIMRDRFCREGFSIHAYCFMPDHCHILAVGMTETCDLTKAVRAFKGTSTASARRVGIRSLWQRDYYDHILRSQESIDAAASYIFENPVRAGLVRDPHDWPLSGSLTFEWKVLGRHATTFFPPWKKARVAAALRRCSSEQKKAV